jgi:hypothetical protein
LPCLSEFANSLDFLAGTCFPLATAARLTIGPLSPGASEQPVAVEGAIVDEALFKSNSRALVSDFELELEASQAATRRAGNAGVRGG